jgi:hypothetical protein
MKFPSFKGKGAASFLSKSITAIEDVVMHDVQIVALHTIRDATEVVCPGFATCLSCLAH